jgi:hypothetical protein
MFQLQYFKGDKWCLRTPDEIMPKRFIRTERAIEREMKAGKIPKYYFKGGHRYKSNAYALARHATGYYGTTHHIGLIHPLKKRTLKGGFKL